MLTLLWSVLFDLEMREIWNILFFCAQVYKQKGGNNMKGEIPCPYLFVEKPLSLTLTTQLVWKIHLPLE